VRSSDSLSNTATGLTLQRLGYRGLGLCLLLLMGVATVLMVYLKPGPPGEDASFGGIPTQQEGNFPAIILTEASERSKPHWTPRHSYTDGKRLYVVGRADKAVELEPGILQAQHNAIVRLVERLEWEIRSDSFVRILQPLIETARARSVKDQINTSQGTSTDKGKKEITTLIAQRFMSMVQEQSLPSRVYWERFQVGPGRGEPSFYSVYVALEINRDQIVASLKKYEIEIELDTFGFGIIPTYPTFAWYTGSVDGVLVITVKKKSLAAQVGLSPGDQVIEVDKIPIKTEIAFSDAVKDMVPRIQQGGSVEFTILRGAVRRTVVFKPGVPQGVKY